MIRAVTSRYKSALAPSRRLARGSWSRIAEVLSAGARLAVRGGRLGLAGRAGMPWSALRFAAVLAAAVRRPRPEPRMTAGAAVESERAGHRGEGPSHGPRPGVARSVHAVAQPDEHDPEQVGRCPAAHLAAGHRSVAAHFGSPPGGGVIRLRDRAARRRRPWRCGRTRRRTGPRPGPVVAGGEDVPGDPVGRRLALG